MQRQLPLAMRRALFLAAAIACSSDKTTAPPQSIQIAVSTPLVSVQRGGTISLTASLIRGGGFDGPVTLVVSGLPDGVSATLTPDELTGATTTATINLVVSSAVVTGSYTVTVTASASIDDVETTCVLRITDPPDFLLSAASELTVMQGNSVSTTIQITRVGDFDGAVSFTLADPLPAGIHGTFQPAIATGNSSILALTVAASTVPGQYLVPVYGASASLPTRVLTLRLTVTSFVAPDFELVIEPSALTVRPGETVTAGITLISIGGYDKYADLSLVSPPAGISAVFQWHYGSVASMLISVAATVAPATYRMTVSGTADVGTHTASFTLTVTDMDFALIMNPAALSIESGSSEAVNINITRSGGYNGSVTLSLLSPPAGITATFTPVTVSANSASMTLNVAAGVPPQTYTLTVRGTGVGAGTRDATVTLTVFAPPPGFSLDVPPALTAIRGNEAYTIIEIVRRGGFSGAVSFTLAGPLPDGIQGEFWPAAMTTGNSVWLTLTIATSVVVGQYPITINATAGALPVKTATFVLNVTASQGPDYELIVSPNTLTVKAGYSVIGNVFLVPYNGYDRYADLSLESPPSGVTALFEWYYGWVADMSIYVAPTVAPGTYAMVLKGTAQVGTRTTSFTLIVTAAGEFSLVTDPAAWQGIPRRQ